MNRLTQMLTVMGYVTEVSPEARSFKIKSRSGDEFAVFTTMQTTFGVLQNLDSMNNDRVPNPDGKPPATPSDLVRKYIGLNQLVVVQGVLQVNGDNRRFDARSITLQSCIKDKYLFEDTHWWLTQTARLADQWLDSLFGDKRTYDADDWVKLYHTNLSIYGLPTNDDTQECAVLSRLIYGLSAAYLIVGADRYRQAAEAAVKFQRDSFRSLSHDSTYCFWAFGRRQGKYGTELLVPSQSGDDTGSIPLYEQIYALAGLANYYRISLDWEVLEDIRRSVKAFNDFFLDELREGDSAFRGYDGYFSHIDYATMRPDQNSNAANNLKKNWNSVGDHIPAYLVNLLLALDPLPALRRLEMDELLQTSAELLERSVTLILNKFPDENPNIPYVNERFFADWKPDHTYSWQQNRAVIGHNFKIAWNLTRAANYFKCKESKLNARCAHSHGDTEGAKSPEHYRDLAGRCMMLAEKLCKAMSEVGIDQIRGGCFDCVEREPYGGSGIQPVEFTWLNTKDFWQQEQAILAYLILFGHTRDPFYLKGARETEAYWNTFFLDRDHRGMYFRVTENGLPVVQGGYEVRGGHSDASGYHCFELNYLAHIYNRAYVARENGTDPGFCLYFKPNRDCGLSSINVLPDFVPPESVEIEQVSINGIVREHVDPRYFQVSLSESDLGAEVVVRLRAVKEASGK